MALAQFLNLLELSLFADGDFYDENMNLKKLHKKTTLSAGKGIFLTQQ